MTCNDAVYMSLYIQSSY